MSPQDKIIKELEFKALCWNMAKEHFRGLDKEHISNMIEYVITKRLSS